MCDRFCYQDQTVVTPPESTELTPPARCPTAAIQKECNCYGLPVSQYTLPAELGGRDASTACSFKCIFAGLQFKKQQLPSLQASTSLTPQQKATIANVIVDGNTLHNIPFKGQAINLDVEDAF